MRNRLMMIVTNRHCKVSPMHQYSMSISEQQGSETLKFTSADYPLAHNTQIIEMYRLVWQANAKMC